MSRHELRADGAAQGSLAGPALIGRLKRSSSWQRQRGHMMMSRPASDCWSGAAGRQLLAGQVAAIQLNSGQFPDNATSQLDNLQANEQLQSISNKRLASSSNNLLSPPEDTQLVITSTTTTNTNYIATHSRRRPALPPTGRTSWPWLWADVGHGGHARHGQPRLALALLLITLAPLIGVVSLANESTNASHRDGDKFPSQYQTAQQILIYATNEPRLANQPEAWASSWGRPAAKRHKLAKRAALGAAAAAATANRTGRLQLEVDALGYLQRFGYMNESTGNAQLISEDSFHEAVVSFQRFAGIPETGLVDGLTVKYMQMPRCGNKDHSSGAAESGRRKRRRRKKRYALQGSKWRRHELSYRISQYPTRFLQKRHEVDAQIERAFRLWSQVAPIDFVPKREGRVHIEIRFASGEHGDGDPFDGPGNTLAHAYFPQYGGDAHFDDQEYWTVDSFAGTNIFQVAAHELGHSLGLGHSSVREALMAPFYQKYKPNFRLHPDDVLAIQALYGEKPDESTGAPPPTASSTGAPASEQPSFSGGRRKPPPQPPQDTDNEHQPDEADDRQDRDRAPDLCQEPKIDAITRTEDGNTYVFRGQHYWLVRNEGLAGGYPARISRDWDGLPGNLDAALTWSDGKTFFFKGDKYWRFHNKRREPGYPKLISAGFAGIPNNLEAAFVWGGNGKTYFFKRDKYWRFDSKQEPPVGSQYPKSVKNWAGLPATGLDAAFKWDNGLTYFFKDDLYYRFDDREFAVDQAARPSFPRSTAEWWFGCSNSNLPLIRRRLGGEPSGATGTGSSTPDEAEPGASSGEPRRRQLTSSGSSSSLVFHRRPNLTYESQAEAEQRASSLRPAGASITRSILTSLSALFPSGLGGVSEAPGALVSERADTDDWAYHRGVGEEARRPPKGARSDPLPRPDASSDPDPSAGAREQRRRADRSRWSFPLGAAQPPDAGPAREQSMSELRLRPPTPLEPSDPELEPDLA